MVVILDDVCVLGGETVKSPSSRVSFDFLGWPQLESLGVAITLT